MLDRFRKYLSRPVEIAPSEQHPVNLVEVALIRA
jgi:hypothetical protein